MDNADAQLSLPYGTKQDFNYGSDRDFTRTPAQLSNMLYQDTL